MLEEGIQFHITKIVTVEDTAVTRKSGELEVLATPVMAALMEEVAWKSIKSYIDEGMSSVGTMLHMTHLSPTPIGMEITCESILVEINGRKLVFKLKVCDAEGLIGEGIHERVLVKKENFQKKADAKKHSSVI